MGWKQIQIPEEPDFLEFHRGVMSAIYGAGTLKVWNASGYWTASFTEKDGARHRFGDLKAKNPLEAQTHAMIYTESE